MVDSLSNLASTLNRKSDQFRLAKSEPAQFAVVNLISSEKS